MYKSNLLNGGMFSHFEVYSLNTLDFIYELRILLFHDASDGIVHD